MLQLSLVSVHLFSLKNLSTLGTKTARKLRHKFHNNGQVCLQLVDHYGWNCNSVKNSEWHFFIFILINFTSRRQLYKQPFIATHLTKMRRATGPFKQLNSEGIKGATLGYMSPVIAGQCSIVSAKCVWNVSEKELAKSWNNICKKRDLCDRALSG